MKRLLAVVLSAAAVAACNTTSSIGPPPPPVEPPSAAVFRPQDFAWSTASGSASIAGALTYRAGQVRYSCNGGDVVLTPETLWSRRRMTILYGSPSSAAVPVDAVRARTPSAPSGDYAAFVRHAPCDQNNRFNFSGLPSGAWFVITVAKPVGAQGASVAVMRRIETRNGQTRNVTLN